MSGSVSLSTQMTGAGGGFGGCPDEENDFLKRKNKKRTVASITALPKRLSSSFFVLEIAAIAPGARSCLEPRFEKGCSLMDRRGKGSSKEGRFESGSKEGRKQDTHRRPFTVLEA